MKRVPEKDVEQFWKKKEEDIGEKIKEYGPVHWWLSELFRTDLGNFILYRERFLFSDFSPAKLALFFYEN